MNEKGKNLPFLGSLAKWYQNRNRGGTGTTLHRPNGTGTKAKWYRYHSLRIGLVPVPIQVVLVPLIPTALICGILTWLRSNSHTEGIGTLINE